MSETAFDDDRTPAAVGVRKRRIGLRAGLALAAAGLVAGGMLLFSTAPAPAPIEGDPDRGIAIDTLRIAPVPLQPSVEESAMVEARRQVELFSEQGGRVLEVGAEELDRVEAGQLLVRLDPLTAEVDVARAEAELARAQSELGLARNQLRRRQNLASSKVTSESELDQAQNDERVAVANVRAADASLRDARDRLDETTIEAPFAGVLRRFHAEPGEVVQPGEQIGELLEVSHVRIEIGLRDREVVAVAPGAPAEVRVEALPGERFTGTVLRVAGAADAETRKFPVQIEIDNADERLLPGMVARVALDLGDRRTANLVPRDAVLDEFGLSFVYVIEEGEDGQAIARRRRVRAGDVPFQPAELEIAEGLAAGERIATSHLRQLRDGVRVDPRTVVAAETTP